MKKHSVLIALSLIVLLILHVSAALAESAPTDTPASTPADSATPSPTPIALKAMMEAYGQVLAGKQTYIQCNNFGGVTGEATLLLSEITNWYGYEFPTPKTFVEFCVTDLDADGNPEIILKLSDDYGFELLRYENGTVYGFPFDARAMEDITLEGDIHGSSGAADSSWYQVRFQGSEMKVIGICNTQDDLAGGIKYFIDDMEVTKIVYEAYQDGFKAKNRPTWLDYTTENFQEIVSRF